MGHRIHQVLPGSFAGQRVWLTFEGVDYQATVFVNGSTVEGVQKAVAELDGDTLVFETLPTRAKYPVRVIVSAFQWGRSNEPKVQSAGPVTREFFIHQ